MTDEDRWYVGQTRSGLGPWAEKNLTAQSYRHYVPRVLDPDGQPGGNLFPRYILIHCPPSELHWSRINSTRGMHKLLPIFAEEPLPVRDRVVDDLMARVGLMGRLDVAEEIVYDYAREQRIEVTCGEWAGRHGEYQYRKRNLAKILIAMMGRKVEVTVPLHHTRPLVPDRLAC